MTALQHRPERVAPQVTVEAPRRRRSGTLLFSALAMLYFAIGYLLVMRYNLFDPDATSRVANADYVISSRDPHLSAIGFVWNPLPSLVEGKYWPPVGRVDNVFGDRNLVCACPSIESYQDA